MSLRRRAEPETGQPGSRICESRSPIHETEPPEIASAQSSSPADSLPDDNAPVGFCCRSVSDRERERRPRGCSGDKGGVCWTRFRSLVADRARSRVRGEDVGDGSAAEDGGAHRFDGERRDEDPLARAQDDRVDDKAVLVDQAGLDKRSGEPCPALGEQVSVGGAAA